MAMKHNKSLKFIVLILIILLSAIVLWKPMIELFANAQALRDLLRGFGVLGPLILIFLIVLQVILAPIPGQAAGIVSGFVYGTALGTIISMTGIVIGSFLAMSLSRRYGRPFVEKAVSKRVLATFDRFSEGKGLKSIFFIFLLPGLPDDAVCFIAGLTKIPLRTLVIIAAIGRFPGFLILNMIGSGLVDRTSPLTIIIFCTLIGLSLILYWKRDSFLGRS